MLVTNGKIFNTVEFSPFIANKICRAGSPVFSISAGRELRKFEKWLNRVLFGEYSNHAIKYEFLNNDLLREAMLNLPFYVKILLKITRFFDKLTKKLRKTA